MRAERRIVILIGLVILSPRLAWGGFFNFSSEAPSKQEEKPKVHPMADLMKSVQIKFNNQAGAQKQYLGATAEGFQVTERQEGSVHFWVRIYTEFGRNEGVVHDTENLRVVYDRVNFGEIINKQEVKEREKEKIKQNLIDSKKKEISESLKRIAESVDPSEWTEFDKTIYSLWEPEGGIEALRKAAADPSRLRFQLGQRDQMKGAIEKSGRYLSQMESIFQEEGLPIQLTRIVFVESSFNVLARSKVGASGLWQIMPSAARGRLTMNRIVDLRNHPMMATKLAARIFKFNYEMVEDWPLAITGYNHGPYGIQRLSQKYNTKNIDDLIESGDGPRFGFASRNFYVSFLAAMIVEGNAETFFPDLRRLEPLGGVELALAKPMYFSDLLQYFDGDFSQAQLFNPHLQRSVYLGRVPFDNRSRVLVPKDKVNFTIMQNKPMTPENKALNLDPIRPQEKGILKSKRYRVVKGDTIYSISQAFNISIRALLNLNGLRGSSVIKAGQFLKLP